MGYNYQDAPRESQQEYFGKKTKRVVDLENQVRFMGMQIDNLKAICRTDNKETLQNALKRIEELEKELEAEKKLNEEIKVRFVKCNTCTDEMKSKCLMFSENLCEGDRCEELVDLLELINKSDLQRENAELKSELTKKADTNHSLVEQMADLEHENALLKGSNKSFEQQIMGLLIKYEEVYKRFPDLKSAMDDAQVILKENAKLKEENKKTSNDWLEACNKYGEVNLRLAKAKELLNEFLDFESCCIERGIKISDKIRAEAEAFLKETE